MTTADAILIATAAVLPWVAYLIVTYAGRVK